MSRQEAIEKLAEMLENHRPHSLFVCDCMMQAECLNETWETHVATIALEAAKGF